MAEDVSARQSVGLIEQPVLEPVRTPIDTETLKRLLAWHSLYDAELRTNKIAPSADVLRTLGNLANWAATEIEARSRSAEI